MTTWIAVLGVAAGSYLLRAVPLFVPRLARPSAGTERVLASAGTASIAALVATAWHHQLQGGDPSALVAALGAGGLAALLALRGRPLWLVVGAGVAAHQALLALPIP